MSTIKSFSVGNGDMFYIDHNSDNFTVIDCHYTDDNNKRKNFKEIKDIAGKKGMRRFISTHPDEDHIKGIKELFDNLDTPNFYCVKNNAIESNETQSFKDYCSLRDGQGAYFLHKGCTRCWLNDSNEVRDSSGISILWPDVSNQSFKDALKKSEEGYSCNNISPIIKYSLKNSATVLWFGDMESDYMEAIYDSISLPKADIIFASHHGRKSGTIPSDWLKKIDPKVIIIGEASSSDLQYYPGYETITQNSAGDITMCLEDNCVDFFVSSLVYKYLGNLPKVLIDNKKISVNKNETYIGSLML